MINSDHINANHNTPLFYTEW